MRNIGGTLDLSAMGQLYGQDDPDEARMRHFHVLDHDAQAAAVRRMAALGRTEYVIAAATRLSVEMVRRILGGHPRQEPSPWLPRAITGFDVTNLAGAVEQLEAAQASLDAICPPDPRLVKQLARLPGHFADLPANFGS